MGGRVLELRLISSWLRGDDFSGVRTLIPIKSLRRLHAGYLRIVVSVAHPRYIEQHTSRGGPSPCPRLITVCSALDKELPSSDGRRGDIRSGGDADTGFLPFDDGGVEEFEE